MKNRERVFIIILFLCACIGFVPLQVKAQSATATAAADTTLLYPVSKTVPESYREGAFALGAGKWRVIRTVVLPTCINGIITGCILSIGRILSESAALLFTAGFAHNVNGFIRGMGSAGATLTVALYVYASERGEFDIAFAIAAILMILTVIINLLTTYMGKLMERRNGQ